MKKEIKGKRKKQWGGEKRREERGLGERKRGKERREERREERGLGERKRGKERREERGLGERKRGKERREERGLGERKRGKERREEKNRRLENLFPGIWRLRKTIMTKNLVKGRDVYGEKLFKIGKEEYREWQVKRSKLGAAIKKGLKQLGLKEGHNVLYLGAASGTTISHISDIIGKGGMVIGVEISAMVLKDLVFLAEERKNIMPVLGDANLAGEYEDKIKEWLPADFLYQDIAQRNQLDIFLKNLKYLKKESFGFLALKARSIDVSKKSKEIFKEVRKRLEGEKGVQVVDYRELYPLEKDHCVFVVKKV